MIGHVDWRLLVMRMLDLGAWRVPRTHQSLANG